MKKIRIALTQVEGEQWQRFADLLQRAIPDLELVLFANGHGLLEALRETLFDGILLNSELPDINALNALRQIRLAPNQRHTPIVILAEEDDSRTAVRAIKLGANDYLALQKTDLSLLRQTILTAINSAEQSKALEQHQQQLKVQALTDPLTSLLNRRAFSSRLETLIELQGSQERNFAVIMIDLNQFKQVNDKFGHEAGDQVLIEIAERLRQITRCDDSVFRIGGDEFVIIIDNNPSVAAAEGLAERLNQNMQAPVSHQDRLCYPGGGSIGVALFPRDGLNPQELISAADQAMYVAKSRGGGVFMFGDDEG